MVIAKDEWQHLLELLDARHAQGYRIDQELPTDILIDVADSDNEYQQTAELGDGITGTCPSSTRL